MELQGDRSYHRGECAVFLKTNERFGGLSNMAGGYPLCINGIRILTSEALYQACRFPHKPEIQKLIIGQASPMTAKMKSKPYRKDSRLDWDEVRVQIMHWCLRVKLAQHWEKFADLLLSTGDQPIVEESYRDPFWGAKPINSETLTGTNVLGQLLTALREQLKNRNFDELEVIEPPNLPHFLLIEKPIGVIESPKPVSRPILVPTLAGSANYEQLTLKSDAESATPIDIEEVSSQGPLDKTFTLISPVQSQLVAIQYELPLEGIEEALSPQKPNIKSQRKKVS